MIIGLTGKYCAGKGIAAGHLMKKGFGYYSLSDVVREETRKKNLEIFRENLIKIGNDLRKEFGNDVIARRIMERVDINRNYVIDSFRNPAEVKAFREREGFFLFFVDAPAEKRFERCLERKREGDPETLQEFRKLEEIELKSRDSNAQQLEECRKLADYCLINDGTKEELWKKVDEIMKDMPKNFSRPSWDEYFMNVAKVVGQRSNCIKRKVAAIIVKDKRIISTGYNGTPRGVKNCSEGGCPRCNDFGESGKNLEECYCSHAEENSIVQSAYHGISVKGGTLYSTFSPCLMCAKMIINAGIERVVYNADYPLNESVNDLFKQAGIKLEKLKI